MKYFVRFVGILSILCINYFIFRIKFILIIVYTINFIFIVGINLYYINWGWVGIGVRVGYLHVAVSNRRLSITELVNDSIFNV